MIRMNSAGCVPALCAGVLAMAVQATPASAQDFPRVSGEAAFEVQNDYHFSSDDPANELDQLSVTVEPEVTVAFTDALSFTAGFVFEVVRDPASGEHHILEDHGLYAEQIFASYRIDSATLMAGKFNPAFGAGWDAAPGIYGTDFAEDYELTERIGLGGSYALEVGGLGEHTLSAAVFFADTTFLSDSVFTARGDTQESDGGAGNTEMLNNFAIAADGGVPGLDGVTYHLGFQRQEPGIDGNTAQIGMAAALTGKLEFGSITVAPVIEYAYFSGFEGQSGAKRHYITTGVEVAHGPYAASVSHTWRGIREAGGDENDHLYTVSLGYRFENGISADIGWRRGREAGVTTDTFGTFIGYALTF